MLRRYVYCQLISVPAKLISCTLFLSLRVSRRNKKFIGVHSASLTEISFFYRHGKVLSTLAAFPFARSTSEHTKRYRVHSMYIRRGVTAQHYQCWNLLIKLFSFSRMYREGNILCTAIARTCCRYRVTILLFVLLRM